MKSIRLVSAIVAVGILLTSCSGYRKGSEVRLDEKTEACLEEDIAEDPDCEEHSRYYIDQLDKGIEKYMKETDYVSVYDI